MCEVEISCIIEPYNENTGDISQPNWDYAPILKRSSVVSAGNLNFQLTEDVDFGEQFNSDGYSNRTFTPRRDGNGIITAYTVTKSTVVINGVTRIFKKVILNQDLKPFMDIVLPEKDVMNVESIIFKESSNFKKDPEISEFYIDAERYKMTNEASETYRFFEMSSLVDQYRFTTDINIGDKDDDLVIQDFFNPHMYEDYTETYTDEDGMASRRTTRYYRGKWTPVSQKFITERTDNGYLKIIFGAGVHYNILPPVKSKFSERLISNMINNDMLGVLHKIHS